MNLIKNILFIVAMLAHMHLLAQADTLKFSAPQMLGKTVNSNAEESFPIVGQDGKMLYFARTFHPGNKGGKMSGQDIWKSELKGDAFLAAKNFGALNNEGSNVVVGITRDGNRVYLLNQFIDKNTTKPGLSYSDYADGAWGEPQVVNVPELMIKEVFYSAFVSAAEDFILWSIPVKGRSGNDLFISLSSDMGGTWTGPMALGGSINSGSDEISPFYDASRSLLFYSKNVGNDPNDYDIYYARRLDASWTSWTAPVRLAEGINSPDFDAYFFMEPRGGVYFCSNRGDSLSNIYLSELSPSFSIDVSDSIEAIKAVVKSKIPNPVLIIETTDGGSTTKRILESLTREELLNEDTRIRFVYFDYDKYNISAKYIEVLDDAASLLDKYPEMRMEIIGHTDSVASDAYNNALSENRAYSAKEFLVINGVEPSRISVKGMGEKEPYAPNRTEEGRAFNRRVELFFREW